MHVSKDNIQNSTHDVHIFQSDNDNIQNSTHDVHIFRSNSSRKCVTVVSINVNSFVEFVNTWYMITLTSSITHVKTILLCIRPDERVFFMLIKDRVL